jgi:hypothetical protein
MIITIMMNKVHKHWAGWALLDESVHIVRPHGMQNVRDTIADPQLSITCSGDSRRRHGCANRKP